MKEKSGGRAGGRGRIAGDRREARGPVHGATAARLCRVAAWGGRDPGSRWTPYTMVQREPATLCVGGGVVGIRS